MRHTVGQKGFTVIEALLILIIFGILGGIGYYVWNAQNQTSNTLDSAKNTSNTSLNSTAAPVLSKSYTNNDYGFSFKYPANWKLTTDIADGGRVAPEGKIYVESPDGTRVHFDIDQGGKGGAFGDCSDPGTNPNKTSSVCDTVNTSSVTLVSGSGAKAIWLVEASDTPPANAGGKILYTVYLTSGSYNDTTGAFDVVPAKGTVIGEPLIIEDAIKTGRINGGMYVTSYVEPKNENSNHSENFLKSKTVLESIPILKSFKLL